MSRITEDTAMQAVTAQLGAHTLQGYWAVIPYQNGLVTFKESPGGGAFVPELHRVQAIELSTLLNREIAFGGKWIVSWSEFDLATGMPRHLSMLWMDKDGDVPFVVDSDEDQATQIYGMHEYVNQCAEAYATWREMMKDVDVREGQKIAAGLGQLSVDERAAPDVIPFL